MALDLEMAAAAGGAGTSPARVRIHHAAVCAMRGLAGVAGVWLAALSTRPDHAYFLMESGFCALLVGVVDAAHAELLGPDEASARRFVIQAGLNALAFATGGCLPALIAMGPPEGRLIKLFVLSTIGFAALGTGTAATGARTNCRPVIRAMIRSVLVGWVAVLLIFLILTVFARRVSGEVKRY